MLHVIFLFITSCMHKLSMTDIWNKQITFYLIYHTPFCGETSQYISHYFYCSLFQTEHNKALWDSNCNNVPIYEQIIVEMIFFSHKISGFLALRWLWCLIFFIVRLLFFPPCLFGFLLLCILTQGAVTNPADR